MHKTDIKSSLKVQHGIPKRDNGEQQNMWRDNGHKFPKLLKVANPQI